MGIDSVPAMIGCPILPYLSCWNQSAPPVLHSARLALSLTRLTPGAHRADQLSSALGNKHPRR